MFGDKRPALLCCLFHASRHADSTHLVLHLQCTGGALCPSQSRSRFPWRNGACHTSVHHFCEQRPACFSRLPCSVILLLVITNPIGVLLCAYAWYSMLKRCATLDAASVVSSQAVSDLRLAIRSAVGFLVMPTKLAKRLYSPVPNWQNQRQKSPIPCSATWLMAQASASSKKLASNRNNIRRRQAITALVQVASVQTLVRRLNTYNWRPESQSWWGHHAVAGSWERCLAHYKDAKVGVTAT